MTRLAAIQFCAGRDWDTNRDRLSPLLEAAAGADLVLLPENFACYGGDYRGLAEQISPVTDWLSAQAQRLNSWLVAGSLPLVRRPDGQPVPSPRVRAAQLVFSPDGRQIARYDKLHLFDAQVTDAQGRYCESAVFEPGDKLVMTQAAGISCGLAICYDLRFAAQALRLSQEGAELLLYPSAFTRATGRAHWDILLKARAVETGCFVLAANLCGQHSDKRASYGHSMLVDPWGQTVASLGQEEGVMLADMELQQLINIRQRLPTLTHQRLGVDVPDDIQFEKQL